MNARVHIEESYMKPWRWVIALPFMACGPTAVGRPVAHSSIRPDGSTISWYLDRQAGEAQQPMLVLAQGSGCTSVTSNANIEVSKKLMPSAVIVTVEKYGVLEGDAPKAFPEDCRAAYTAHHTISQRVADYSQVIADLRKEAWWNGKLVLFGGSEGGAAIQILAAEVHPNAAVIFSSATGIPFREAFVRVLPPSEARTVPKHIAAIRKNPTSTKTWLANSYLWWSDIMDRRLSDDALRATTTEFLVVQGQWDQSNPVISARYFADNFRKAGRSNLTYWEFPDYDHTMIDRQGQSHMTEVLSKISNWLNETLVRNRTR
jgi:pimeloyl-ACP methyl ester carboxylesterase